MNNHARIGGIVVGGGLTIIDAGAVVLLAAGVKQRWANVLLAGMMLTTVGAATYISLDQVRRDMERRTRRLAGEHNVLHARMDGIDRRIKAGNVEAFSLGVSCGAGIEGEGGARIP